MARRLTEILRLALLAQDDSMKDPHRADLTALLHDVVGGSKTAVNHLLPLVYGELRQLAHGKLRFERRDHTLQTTALVHEAYLKLIDQRNVAWESRAHFFAIAATAMRRVLAEYARARNAEKRGGGNRPLPLDELRDGVGLSDDQAAEILGLDEALTLLAAFNPRGAQVVEMRYFVGLTHEEIASVLDVSVPTVRRAWSAARAWLRDEL
ncbi:MAG: sigma-70 family RNA polymerase sigma factor [Bacteroidota bacterium]